ncbi:MAG: A/G-specific adenine glycosylase, partial [Candidatus Sungiibacteriota bacterium]
MKIATMKIRKFRHEVSGYYRRHCRDMPWRRTKNPYHILVSEIMLQQTQVERVIGYYEKFLARFPDIAALARASLADVLAAWQGLGYNRRALYLKRAAEEIVTRHGSAV